MTADSPEQAEREAAVELTALQKARISHQSASRRYWRWVENRMRIADTPEREERALRLELAMSAAEQEHEDAARAAGRAEAAAVLRAETRELARRSYPAPTILNRMADRIESDDAQDRALMSEQSPLEEARARLIRHAQSTTLWHYRDINVGDCCERAVREFEAAAKAEAVELLETLIEHVRHEADMLIRHHDTFARDVRVRLHKQADIVEARRALSTEGIERPQGTR